MKCFTYYHVLQSMFGQPAIEKYRDEKISQGGQNHLSRRKSSLDSLSHHRFIMLHILVKSLASERGIISVAVTPSVCRCHRNSLV